MSWLESKWLPLFLLVASAATHFIGLGYPREVVFDEVHFGKFVTSYCCTGARFFDIHPPHAKLLVAAAVKLSGYDGSLSFENIGQSYGAYSPVPWRIVPALAGTLLPLIIFGVLRELKASRPAAFFGAVAVLLDNALTVQTRIIALDGVLLAATFGSLWAYLRAEHAQKSWSAWAAVAGVLAGVAVGSKFTGLVALGLIGVVGMYRVVRSGTYQAMRRWLSMGALIVVSAAVVYVAGWALHFMLLTEPGSGDAWGIPEWTEPVVVSFGRELIDLHKTMYNANNGLTVVHHDSSPWSGWPFMNNPVFYWRNGAPEVAPRLGAIYFIGNPLVWIGSTVLLLATLAWIMLELFRYGSPRSLRTTLLVIPLIGYAMSFWPLTRVDRGLFLYHYLTPLLFALIIGTLWLDQRGWFTTTKHARWVYASLALLLLFFILFSPLTFGLLLQPDTQGLLFWSDKWR